MEEVRVQCLVYLFSLFLLLSVTSNVQGDEFSSTNEKCVSVEFPEKLEIPVGGEKIAKITIKNVCNQTLQIYVDAVYVEMQGHTICNLSDNYFQLSPGESKELMIYLRAAKKRGPLGAEDVTIKVYWGHNLSVDSQGNLLWNSVEGYLQYNIDIIIKNSLSYILWIIGILAGISAMIILVLRGRRRKKGEQFRGDEYGDSGGAS